MCVCLPPRLITACEVFCRNHLRLWTVRKSSTLSFPCVCVNCVAHLRRVGAETRPESNAGAAGARAGAVFAPGAPGPVLLDLIWVLPHAVTFVAPLQRTTGSGGEEGET